MHRIASAMVVLSVVGLVGCASRPAHQAVRPATVADVTPARPAPDTAATATATATAATGAVTGAITMTVAPTPVSLAGARSAAAAASADVGALRSQDAQAGQDLSSSEGDPGQ